MSRLPTRGVHEDEEYMDQELDDYKDYLKSQKIRKNRRRRSSIEQSLDSISSHHHVPTPQRRGKKPGLAAVPELKSPLALGPSTHHTTASTHPSHPPQAGGGRRRNVRRQTMQALQVLGMRQGEEEWQAFLATQQQQKSSHHHHQNRNQFARMASGMDLVDEEDPGDSFHMDSGHLAQTKGDNHGHDNHHGHGHHQLMLPWYCAPVQRQLWDDDQVLPHVNWHDLFFDLIFVAAAYNLGAMLITTMNEHDWPRGVVYFIAIFGPLFWIWENDVIYASRFTLVDYSHRIAAVLRFLCVSFAVLSIKPIHQLSDRHSAETFVFCTSLFVESLVQLALNLELYLYGEGDRKAIQNQTRRETFTSILPASLTYLIATLIAAYGLFYTEPEPKPKPYDTSTNGDYGDEGYGSSYGNDTSTYGTDYSNATSDAYFDNGYRRFLAGESSESIYPVKDGVNWAIDDLPLVLCLAAYIVNILFSLYQRSTQNKNIDVREHYVPNNIDYMIHRYGEWIMLMIGESILSLLIVETVEAHEYYAIAVLGCLTVIVLQILIFESQPSHADGHALWRSMTAATLYSVSIQVLSISLVAFGVSYKLMLKYVLKDNDPKNDSSSSDSYAEDAHRRLAGSAPVTAEANAWLFCVALAVVLVSLEFMMGTHTGIRASYNLLFRVDKDHPQLWTLNWPLILISVAKAGIILFTATLALLVTVPLDITIVGFVIVTAMAVIRIVGWGFIHHEDLINDKVADLTRSVHNVLNKSVETGKPLQLNEDLNATERTTASTDSPPRGASRSVNASKNTKKHNTRGDVSALTPVDEVSSSSKLSQPETQKHVPRQAQQQAPPVLEESVSSGRHPKDRRESVWMEYTDPQSGDKYYADKEGNTTWEKPTRGKIVRPKQVDGKTSQRSKSKSTLPVGWSEHRDTHTGEKYYMGPDGETQWDRPVAHEYKQRKDMGSGTAGQRHDKKKSGGTKGAKKNRLPKSWIALLDEDTGDTYYYNQKTGQSTWDRPSN